MPKAKLRIIPLGGLSEIGKNMLVLEYRDDIIVIDCGLMFPKEEMLGVDLVIPDISYLIERRDKIRGIVITHGHEDHIGALAYLLPELDVPVYSTQLTSSLISLKLKERKALAKAKLNIVPPGGKFTLGKFDIEFFPVCHSIPDAVGLIITTPLGIIVHSGDFKLDFTPVGGEPTDLSRLAEVGKQGVLLLLSDSTYAELPGYTPSERVVGEALDDIIARAPGRVIITTFASLVSRVQQVIDAAVRYNRRVFVVGRSMTNIVKMAREQGYLHVPDGTLGRLEEAKDLPHDRIVFVTTGSQGEPTSALVRIANRDHRQLHIVPGDTVAISATPIPGNEALVARTVDNLLRQGANVIFGNSARVHVHGHASQEELKLLISIVKPKFFVPIHGEYRHLSLHARIAESTGVPKEHIIVIEDGEVLEVGADTARVVDRVTAGHVYVDGLSVGAIGNVVLRDRQLLSRDGIVIVIITVDRQTGKLIGRPDIVSRGFVDSSEGNQILDSSRDLIAKVLDRSPRQPAQSDFINAKVHDTLNRFYFEHTKRRPMILPFMVKV